MWSWGYLSVDAEAEHGVGDVVVVGDRFGSGRAQVRLLKRHVVWSRDSTASASASASGDVPRPSAARRATHLGCLRSPRPFWERPTPPHHPTPPTLLDTPDNDSDSGR